MGGGIRNPKHTVILISGEFASPSDCHLFTGMEQNHGCCVLNGDDVEMMAGNTGYGLMGQGNRKLVRRDDKCFIYGGRTTWKCSGIAVHLNLDCCLLQLWRGLCGNAVG